MDLRQNSKHKLGISSSHRLSEDNYKNLFVTRLPGAVDDTESSNLYESTVDNCETNSCHISSNPIVIHDDIDYISIMWMLLLISIFVVGIRFLIY